jgi:hypothetical protein
VSSAEICDSVIRRGDLMKVHDGITVPLGAVLINSHGHYEIDTHHLEVQILQPGTMILVLGVPDQDVNALVVLADGEIGWVFRDEVKELQ